MARPKTMWMGTGINDMQKVLCPNANISVGNVPWVSTMTYLNGGAGQRQSKGTHQEISLSWGPTSVEDLAPIMTLLQTGETIYYYDPLVIKSNILPAWMAQPGLQVGDAPTLGLDMPNPDPVTFAASPLGYPTRGASYNVSEDEVSSWFPIIVPDTMELHFGVHGNSTGTAQIRLINFVGGVDTNLTMLSRTTPEMTNTVIAGPALIMIGTTGEGLLNLSGMIAQILPVGSSAPIGSFIPGLGNTGVRVSSPPQITEYSSRIPNYNLGLTVDFIEIREFSLSFGG